MASGIGKDNIMVFIFIDMMSHIVIINDLIVYIIDIVYILEI